MRKSGSYGSDPRTIFQDYCQANGKISRETALQIMEQTDLQKMVDRSL